MVSKDSLTLRQTRNAVKMAIEGRAQLMTALAFITLVVSASCAGVLQAYADTIPCSHRYVETKAVEFFNYVQKKETVQSGRHAMKLEKSQETAQERIAEVAGLRRYCEGALRLDNGETVPVYISILSRDDYKKNRAEDHQTCWDDRKYGVPAIIGGKPGCKDLKAPSRR